MAYATQHLAHLGVTGNRFCEMDGAKFNLAADYVNPKSYIAYETDDTGRRLNDKKLRVRVDHDATGTGTPGTGDTVARRV